MKNDDQRPKGESLSDTLANLVGDAITDVRQRVVEEGFWGRATTTGRDFYEDFWADRVAPSATQAQDKDQSIDR